MTFKELSDARFSVRSYTDEAVSKEQRDYILECARLAPSAVNFQPWHFYIVTKDADREKLQQCYNRDWFKTAPMYIICCIRHDEAWVRKDDQKEHGNIDIAIATEHICLAATEQGLGTCWVCNFDAKLCHKLFSLPENEEAAVLIPLGHPASDVEQKEKNRKAMYEIVTEL
ncbi:MAG: nitroreductase family protein [Prevotella sp.]|nr:nitroreductase family protein [Candidatus Prevotella equi]